MAVRPKQGDTNHVGASADVSHARWDGFVLGVGAATALLMLGVAVGALR